MKTELSMEDKQRIEQFITKLGWDNDGTAEFNDMMKVAEYATIYEREKQAELRNKVIEECIAMICSTAPEYGPIEIGVKKVYELLNSLKK